MPQLNDLKREWLAKVPQSVPRAQLNDMWRAWLATQSTGSDQINDGQSQFNVSKGQSPDHNTGDYTYLATLGRTGSLNDRQFAQFAS